MTKADISRRVSKATGLSGRQAIKAIDAVFNQLRILMSEGSICHLRGFGRFSSRHKVRRIGRNPKTLKEAWVTARTVPVFKSSYMLKDIVNGVNGFNTLFKTRRTRRSGAE